LEFYIFFRRKFNCKNAKKAEKLPILGLGGLDLKPIFGKFSGAYCDLKSASFNHKLNYSISLVIFEFNLNLQLMNENVDPNLNLLIFMQM
jgi:hypothetical protein